MFLSKFLRPHLFVFADKQLWNSVFETGCSKCNTAEIAADPLSPGETMRMLGIEEWLW